MRSVLRTKLGRALGVTGLWALASIAHAELGGPVSSVAADSGRMSAKMASVARGAFARHELTRSNDGIVREYTNAGGLVFAVTWSGPGKPDLRTLLGRYFTTFQANSEVAARSHALRRPAQVSQPDLQIQTSGHMGWFSGVAFVPSLAPPGFAMTELAPELVPEQATGQ